MRSIAAVTHGWRRYELPSHWTPERRDIAITQIIAAVGRPLMRHGEVDRS